MLDPRVYRAAFVPALFALVVAAFSLREPQRGSTTSLAPDAFVGQRAFDGPGTGLRALAAAFPRRRPGGPGDAGVARRVADAFRASGLQTSVRRFDGDTAVGRRSLRDVIGVRAGVSNRRVVVLAHRDALASPATADLSGTAVLVELARVFQGRSLGKTLVLVSTSGGSGGDAGAGAFARDPGGPVDGVIVLGDLASPRSRGALLVPWSDGLGVAPEALRRTVASAVGLEAGRRVREPRVASQFARLAFPLTVSEQGPPAGRGLPALLLSVTGERGPGAATAVSQDRLQQMGRAVLRTVSALDGRAAPIPAPRADLLYRRKLIPPWAVRLVVGALILPALLAAVDGFARVRRRREPVTVWLAWTLSAGLPLLLAWLFALLLELTGLLPAIPAAPLPAGALPLDGAAAAALGAVGLAALLGWLLARRLVLRLAGVRGDPASPGAAAAVLLVAVLLGVAVWALNPFAAALLVPALHCGLLLLAPDVRLRPVVQAALLAIAVLPYVLVTVYYAVQLHLSLAEIPWTALQLAVGGHLGLLAVLGWCAGLGALASALAIVRARGRLASGPPAPRTRGPGTYAGPGSLGGTESALRR